MNFASLSQTLPMMLIGMVGIFIVIVAIILVITLLGKLSNR
ncbi:MULTISPECIES: OadG-related small transporter subunit [unclassified Faecalibacterium]|nr:MULTISPECIES: OadG-related small transporter subunit [unclassified Faecalibacterium]OUN40038.1 oxaloacetate decarboxylase [Faecalibacterium sp. An77]OUP28544.1 oxaloacetate decarboxylase [Faecalibacterium sp. An192]OUQ37743.1 oxaloacetate decarboxylase [Faecalibacterium sp. An122]